MRFFFGEGSGFGSPDSLPRWGCPSLTTGNSVLTRELTRHTRAFHNSPSCISTINCFDQHSTKYYMQGVSMQGSGNGHVMGWSWVKVTEGCSISLKSSSISIAQGVEVGRELLRCWNLMQVPQTKIESKNICMRDLKNIKYTYQRLDWHKKLQWSKLKDWFFVKTVNEISYNISVRKGQSSWRGGKNCEHRWKNIKAWTHGLQLCSQAFGQKASQPSPSQLVTNCFCQKIDLCKQTREHGR